MLTHAPLNSYTTSRELDALLPIDVAGNEVTLFVESTPLADAMAGDIRRAQRRVWLESYTIVDDAAGRKIADALVDRASAGVDCRVMYDFLGSSTTSSAYFERLRRSGVKVHAYHTLWYALWRFDLFRVFNKRDHRKLLVIDDNVAYFGGMNIVDQTGLETVSDVRTRHLPISAGWRDVHARLVGPKQAEVAEAFERLWRRQHRQRRRRAPRWPVRRLLARDADAIYCFDTRPGIRFRRASRVLAPMIDRARSQITVSMAYFIPQGAILRALYRASRRGVRVRVIIPGKSDVRLAQWCTRHLYDRLLRHGIRIYERKDQMLHSKVMVIDDDWTMLGSCNLDPRSLRLNLEFFAVMRSRGLATAVKKICGYELRRSRRVSPDDHARRPWRQRLLDRLAWSLRRWL